MLAVEVRALGPRFTQDRRARRVGLARRAGCRNALSQGSVAAYQRETEPDAAADLHTATRWVPRRLGGATC